MFRTPIPNEDKSRLESLGSGELVSLFAASLESGCRSADYGRLADAWGELFSRLYLSGDELISAMERGEHALSGEHERILREFIRADCRSGGLFVLQVIRQGGTIDRSALIMIADPGDLAGIVYNGTTAVHMLATASDAGVRPAFIRKIGRNLLSSLYDSRGIPVIYAIFGLGDISVADLDAISDLFPPEDLKNVMCRNRTGKDAFTVYSELFQSLKSRGSLGRHPFFGSAPMKKSDYARKS